LKSNNQIVKLQKHTKKFDNDFNLSNKLESKKNFEKTLDTYQTLVKIIIKKTNLDQIINFIWSHFDTNKNNYLTSEYDTIKELNNDDDRKIQKLRSEFKQNIKEDRVKLSLIKKDDIETVYSDLEIYQEEKYINNIEARISHLEAAHIFDLFYSENSHKNNDSGTGLGLAVAKGILTAHNGSVEAIPVTHGCLIRICLPITKGDL
jgi:signal transduction histidine kinase